MVDVKIIFIWFLLGVAECPPDGGVNKSASEPVGVARGVTGFPAASPPSSYSSLY
jgi:hypothetical protein